MTLYKSTTCVIASKAKQSFNKELAQSTLEFTFAMTAIMFLIFGMIMIFRWAGMDLANRSWQQTNAMTKFSGTDPSSELNQDIGETALPLVAVYHGTVSNGNASNDEQ